MSDENKEEETKASTDVAADSAVDMVEENQSASEEKPVKKEETAADLLGANIEQVKVRKAKGSKNITSGICFIVATFNNKKFPFQI